MTLWKTPESQTRLIATVVRDVLSHQQFTASTDLKEAVKTRCARLHVPYVADAVNAAITLVESNRPVVTPPVRPSPERPVEHPAVGPREATAILDRYGITVRSGRLAVPVVATRATDAPEDFPTLVAVPLQR